MLTCTSSIADFADAYLYKLY